MLRNTGIERDIPIGFLGSLKSTEYSQRKALLSRFQSVLACS
jgi:hypothetical protein